MKWRSCPESADRNILHQMKEKGRHMQRCIFVIGGTATGKSHFIKNHFAGEDAVRPDIYDYQKRAYDDAGYKDDKMIPTSVMIPCLMTAQENHLHDIIEALKDGHDVIAEQTFFKAKRRITYIDEIRKHTDDVQIDVYVMCPGDALLESNISARGLAEDMNRIKGTAMEMEFPNPAEGFDAIYEVVGDEIRLRMEDPRPEIVSKAKAELLEETARLRKESEDKRKRKELLESMDTRPFWHYCEVCGKKEYMTAAQAHDAGWDYPPSIGHFSLLGPRTCGDCPIESTLYFKVMACKKYPLPVVIPSLLTPDEAVTWRRIRQEPDSLLEEKSVEEGE